jgi:3'-5' exoribonuclease
MRYIEDFKEDDHIVGHYLCKQKQNLKSRAGKTYLSLRLHDRTGQIDAKVWELNNDIQSFEERDFIKVDGIVLIYQNETQLKVTKIRRSQEGEYDPVNYIPSTDKDIETLYSQITDYIKSISNTYIRQMMENIIIKNENIASAFKSHSAAKNMHHSYMGGLLEHTLSVTQICDFMSTRYKYANRDILIATAILHDIGKIYELSAFPDNDYTDDGQLLGHIVMGADIIAEESGRIPGFPRQLRSMLRHAILAHHGEYEFGSPKKPKFIEAFILHCADNMDAKVRMFEEMIEGDNTQGSWVGYSKTLGRNIRKSDFNA